MTKTDENYEAEYEQDRVLRVKDTEARIAANEAIAAANIANTKLQAVYAKTEIERQIAELKAWVVGYDAQRQITEMTKVTLLNFSTGDSNTQLRRLLALAATEEWFARNREQAKVYNDRLAVLMSRLGNL
jgi:hypothetical protein